MTEHGADTKTCTTCGAAMPIDRSVCPTCSSLQRSAPAPAATAPPAAAGGPPAVSPTFSAVPAGPTSMARHSTPAFSLIAIVIVMIGVFAGIGFLVFGGDDDGDKANTAGASSVAGGSTTATDGETTTTVPEVVWTDQIDVGTKLRWRVPATQVSSSPTSSEPVAGPSGVASTTYQSVDEGVRSTTVMIWDAAGDVDPATVPATLQAAAEQINSDGSRTIVADTTDRTIASQPITLIRIVDSDPAGPQTALGAAVVNDSLVYVRYDETVGTEATPYMLNELFASFARDLSIPDPGE